MRKLLLGLALVAGLFAAVPVPAETPRPREVYFLTSTAKLRSEVRALDYHATNGVIPVVILAGNGTNVYRPGWDADAAVGEARRHIDGPMLVALWCDNVRRDEQPGGSTFYPWTDDAGWDVLLTNLRALREACARHQVSGVIWDAEIYTSTPGNNGGLMGRGAWPSHPRARDRGRQVREALAGLTLGQYAYVADAGDFAGWRQFWGGAYVRGDLLLDEGGYLTGDEERRFRGRGVRWLPGRTIRNDRFRGSVPRRSFWVYPWSSDPDLSRFAHLWN